MKLESWAFPKFLQDRHLKKMAEVVVSGSLWGLENQGSLAFSLGTHWCLRLWAVWVSKLILYLPVHSSVLFCICWHISVKCYHDHFVNYQADHKCKYVFTWSELIQGIPSQKEKWSRRRNDKVCHPRLPPAAMLKRRSLGGPTCHAFVLAYLKTKWKKMPSTHI